MPVDPDTVTGVVQDLTTGLRGIGLYVEHTDVVVTPDGQTAVLVEALVGDLAFTRTADPDVIDAELERLTMEASANAFLDRRTEIQRRIAEGRDIFGGDAG